MKLRVKCKIDSCECKGKIKLIDLIIYVIKQQKLDGEIDYMYIPVYNLVNPPELYSDWDYINLPIKDINFN